MCILYIRILNLVKVNKEKDLKNLLNHQLNKNKIYKI